MSLSEWILVCSYIPLLVTVAYGFWRYHHFGRELRIFSWFIFLSGFIQFTSLILWLLDQNNLPLLHLYVPLRFILLVWFYQILLTGYLHKRVLHWAAGLLVLFSLFNTLFLQDAFTFNSNALTLESVLMVVLSLSTFSLHLNEWVRTKKKRVLSSLNWINSGIFLYYASNLLLFYFGQSIMHVLPVELSRFSWVLHALFSSVMYVCFFIGLWNHPRN